MAKRSPVDEEPFRPLNAAILNAVVNHAPDAKQVRLDPPRRLEPVSAARGETEVRVLPRSAPPMARLDQEKRVLFTRAEAQVVERLINNLSSRLHTQVKASHIMRALTVLLLNAESQVYQRAGERGPLTRPPNGDFTALQQFERAIAAMLADAIRDAGPLG